MSEGDKLRELITERLTVAAEDIFEFVKTTVVEYKELAHQRKRLNVLNPNVSLHRTDQPHQLVCKEDESWSEQETVSSPDQEEAEPPRIKEEPEEPCSIQAGEQLEMKEETEMFMLTPAHEERDHSEPELHKQQILSILRELITERQSAAAEDIFELVKAAIIEYKEELVRQQKLLDIFLNPKVYLHRTDMPQQFVCKEEKVLLSEQLCTQDRNSSQDQEEAAPPQIKEEPEEPCSIQEGEQVELKEEADMFMTSAHEGRDHSQPELHDHQPLSDGTHVAKDQDPAESKHLDSELSRNSELTIPDKIHHSRHNTDVSENQCSPLQDQPSIKCTVCGESFKNKSALQTHQRVHSPKRTHSCKICGKMFNLKYSLTAHVRSHTGEKPFTCTTCGKGFVQMSNLKKHNMIHTGEKPFTCTTCGKSFIQQQNLKVHMHTHTGEKPFTCTTCGKAFTQQRDLKVHMRTHTDEKPFSCRLCGKRFFHQKSLRVHDRIHTGDWLFSCNKCGKTCTSSNDLKKHVERIHLGKRPHSCSTCGKGFYSKTEVALHMMIHSDEKPYSCSSCGASFKKRQNLVRHTESKRCFKRATGNLQLFDSVTK